MAFVIVVCDVESKPPEQAVRYLVEWRPADVQWTEMSEAALHFKTRDEAADYLRTREVPISAMSMYVVRG